MILRVVIEKKNFISKNVSLMDAFLLLISTHCEKKINSVYICELQSFTICF